MEAHDQLGRLAGYLSRVLGDFHNPDDGAGEVRDTGFADKHC